MQHRRESRKEAEGGIEREREREKMKRAAMHRMASDHRHGNDS